MMRTVVSQGSGRKQKPRSQESSGEGFMFERYTEKARRVIFFARYEASQFGSPYIETEHLLLGLLREDKALTNRFLRSHASVESIRKQIEGHTTIREKVSTSVDLPLQQRVQARAGLCRGRGGAAVAQTHRDRASAAGPAARREVLCRGDSARARTAACRRFAKSWRAPRRKRRRHSAQPRVVACWRSFRAT